MTSELKIRERFQNLEWTLDERLRRLHAASEAKAIGHGGITLVSKATGVAIGSIKQGLKELCQRLENKSGGRQRIRREGAGRKAAVKVNAALTAALESLVEPVTRGNPESSFLGYFSCQRHND